MLISESFLDDERPTIEGDYIRGILVLGRESKNPADTDRGVRGRSKVTRKFNRLLASEHLAKLSGPAHIGPHRFDGNYPESDLMGSFENPRAVATGGRMDLLCRRIGESFHPQVVALRDHIEHGRAFGGFSPLFDGTIDENTGEVVSIERMISIDWVLNPASLRSVAEDTAVEVVPKSDFDALAARVAALETRPAIRVAESTGGARTVPPPETKKTVQAIDPFKFARGQS